MARIKFSRSASSLVKGNRFIWFFLLLVLAGACRHKLGHDHGTLKLDLIVDGPQVGMRLEGHGESLHGFDHKPASAAEKSDFAKTMAKLKKPAELFQFPVEKKCQIKTTETGANADGHHYIIHAAYTVNCARALQPGVLKFTFGNIFPKVNQIHVRGISDQPGTVPAKGGSVSL